MLGWPVVPGQYRVDIKTRQIAEYQRSLSPQINYCATRKPVTGRQKNMYRNVIGIAVSSYMKVIFLGLGCSYGIILLFGSDVESSSEELLILILLILRTTSRPVNQEAIG